MNLKKQTIVFVMLSGLATFSTLANSTDYIPDTIEFPDSAPIVFPSHPVLGLDAGGAIEFWVVADWTQSPGYHPVILSNGEGPTPLYRISVTAARDALLVQIGGQYGQFEFDFSDRRTHHVALLDYDDKMAALIDGRFSGAVALSIEPGNASYFFIGSAEGGKSPFIGAVSGLRLWEVPLEPEEVADFAVKDALAADSPHPNIDFLVGYSDFRQGGFVIADSFVLNESELMSREEAVAILGEEEIQAIDEEIPND
jgi:concanavalin A-like lectin/glucanase superfamily protein